MKKILVIGSTGMLGKPVTRQLLQAGFDVTLLARDVSKTQQLFPSAKIIQGDVFDKASLVTAMKGINIIYLSLSVLPGSKEKNLQPEREGIENIIEAAKETGIGLIGYLSSLIHFYNGVNGFKWWSFDIKKEAVDKIKASGIPYTIFYPSTFMEIFPNQMMRGNKIAILGNSVAPMWFVAAEDYAKQVARSFQIPGNENKEYNIQGLEPFTFPEAVKIFKENYRKKKLSTIKAPIGLMKFLGNFHQPFNYAWHICEALNKYPEKFESEKTWAELGKPKILLKEYASSL